MIAETGYKHQVGASPQGNPIYLYQDRTGTMRHVVVLPDNRVFYSDASGKIGYPTNDRVSGAIVGAVVGGLTVGGLLGAAGGAVLGGLAAGLSK